MDKKIDIICPIYNGAQYIEKLNHSFLFQKNVAINKIKYILTESDDNSEEVLKKINANYEKIKKKDFSHSITREKEVFSSKADIVVFVTQDVVIEDNNWLFNLTKDIDSIIIATYSRQISKYNNIEKYTREKNYPENSRIVSKEDIKQLGLNTFFFSDASSAINREKFVELKGYDKKDLPISEDMYYAYKVIMNGYKIKYCADSVIYHSHNFTIREIYKRYKLTGKFFKDNKYLDDYGTNNSGWNLAKYVLKRIIEEKKIRLLFRYPFDMAARLVGMKTGEKNEHKNMIKKQKNIYFKYSGLINQRKIKNKRFTIISNNCFGGIIYRNYHIPYQSPTCGLFFMAPEYIKFIYNIKSYLKQEITEIKINDSKYKDYLIGIQYKGIIGKINDIEICFLHYDNIEEAKEKWERRTKRINWDRIIYKFNDQNLCTIKELEAFEKFNAKNKICFTAKKYKKINSIQLKQFENEKYVLDDTKPKSYKKQFDVVKYINSI